MSCTGIREQNERPLANKIATKKKKSMIWK